MNKKETYNGGNRPGAFGKWGTAGATMGAVASTAVATLGGGGDVQAQSNAPFMYTGLGSRFVELNDEEREKLGKYEGIVYDLRHLREKIRDVRKGGASLDNLQKINGFADELKEIQDHMQSDELAALQKEYPFITDYMETLMYACLLLMALFVIPIVAGRKSDSKLKGAAYISIGTVGVLSSVAAALLVGVADAGSVSRHEMVDALTGIDEASSIEQFEEYLGAIDSVLHMKFSEFDFFLQHGHHAGEVQNGGVKEIQSAGHTFYLHEKAPAISNE